MRTKTTDRMTYYTTEKLGKTRETTPEGFMLCREVAIARTGDQIYLDKEIPLEADASGQILISRPATEVFREETIASFEGKPVTVTHPDEFVSPENWQKLSVGVVQNVRRGEGSESDLLIADLLITAQDAIDYANKELPELSAGYEADYEQTEPGRGVQRNIIGNHVALVERGRAGPRCSIQDKEPTMKKRNLWDRLLTAVKAKDAAAIEEELKQAKADDSDELEGTEKKDEAKDEAGSNSVEERLARIEDALVQIAAGGKTADEDEESAKAKKDGETDDSDEEEEEETNDTIIEAEQGRRDGDPEGSVLTGDAMTMVKARAEILCPGIKMPTTDAARTVKSVASFKRMVLTRAMATEDGASCVRPFVANYGGKVEALRGAALDAAFMGASELMRERNNAKGARSGITTRDFGRAVSAADINARNAKFWANK